MPGAARTRTCWRRGGTESATRRSLGPAERPSRGPGRQQSAAAGSWGLRRAQAALALHCHAARRCAACPCRPARSSSSAHARSTSARCMHAVRAQARAGGRSPCMQGVSWRGHEAHRMGSHDGVQAVALPAVWRRRPACVSALSARVWCGAGRAAREAQPVAALRRRVLRPRLRPRHVQVEHAALGQRVVAQGR